MKPPPIDISEENMAYLRSLKPGERVQECERSNCMFGTKGTVYINDRGERCVLWDKIFGKNSQMGTSVTHGTRRIEDIE